MKDALTSQNMTLAPGVIDTIISIAASEVEGIAFVGGRVENSFKWFGSHRPPTSGIESAFDEDGKLHVVIHVEVDYGYVLSELADNLRKAISDALLVQVGVEVASVDIFMDGIQFNVA